MLAKSNFSALIIAAKIGCILFYFSICFAGLVESGKILVLEVDQSSGSTLFQPVDRGYGIQLLLTLIFKLCALYIWVSGLSCHTKALLSVSIPTAFTFYGA